MIAWYRGVHKNCVKKQILPLRANHCLVHYHRISLRLAQGLN